MQISLTEGRIGKTLLTFALPFLLASLLQALYGAADLFVVGRFSDAAAVAAVGIGSQVMQVLTSVILAISMGGTVLIGQYMGGQKLEDVAKTIGCIAWVFALVALLLTPIMLLLTKPVVQWMQTPQEAVSATVQYMMICCCGIPFIVGYNAVSGIFRGMGDSKTPVFFIALACIINIIVDFILVGGFDFGAAGAAVATIAAQAISFFAALAYMKHKGFSFPFHRSHIRLEKSKARRIFKVGLPLAIQDALVHASFLIITAIINTMGLIASASVGVVEKLIVFAMLPPTSFASAVATMTAQNIGAGKGNRALQCLKAGIAYSLVFGITVCLYCQFWPETLTQLFAKNDLQVVEMAARYLKSYSIDCILVCFIFCMNSFFSGCGKSAFSMLHSLIATFLVRIPLSYLLSRQAGVTLYEIGFAAPFATFISLLICIWYLQYQKKRGLLENRL